MDKGIHHFGQEMNYKPYDQSILSWHPGEKAYPLAPNQQINNNTKSQFFQESTYPTKQGQHISIKEYYSDNKLSTNAKNFHSIANRVQERPVGESKSFYGRKEVETNYTTVGEPNKIKMYHKLQKEIQNLDQSRKTLNNLPNPTDESELSVLENFHTNNIRNANPIYIRSSLYKVPAKLSLFREMHLPFGIVICPFPHLRKEHGEVEIAIASLEGPVQCLRCSAYMNPYSQFTDAGRMYTCAFCSFSSPIPADYFNYLDANGKRVDASELPELTSGIYEFPYTCQGKTVAFIFAIEVSRLNVSSGLVNVICKTIEYIIDKIPSTIKIAFLTYDSGVHFYTVSNGVLKSFVMSDVENIFLPGTDGFLLNLKDQRDSILRLIKEIPKMFSNTSQDQVILAPVIQAALEIMNENRACGKIILFHSSLPKFPATGKLKNRVTSAGTIADLLDPQDKIYPDLGKKCAEAGTSVDIFAFNQSYIDLATVGALSQFSGGNLYDFTEFSATSFSKLQNDLERLIIRAKAFNVIAKVRTSLGIEVNKTYGNCHIAKDVIHFGSLPTEQSFAVLLSLEDSLPEKAYIYIQAAIKYLTLDGDCRIRVMNLRLSAEEDPRFIFGSCDIDTIMNIISKQAIDLKSGSQKTSDILLQRAAKILRAYRKNGTEYIKSTQLLLPKTMELFPLYLSCLIKTPAFQNNRIDIAVLHRLLLMSLNVERSIKYIYPRVICLTAGDQTKALRCTYQTFEDQNIYMLENGQHLFVWIGKNVNPTITAGLMANNGFPISVGQESTKLMTQLLSNIENESLRSLKTKIVYSGGPEEVEMRQLLYEDPGPGKNDSYINFVIKLHKKISSKVVV